MKDYSYIADTGEPFNPAALSDIGCLFCGGPVFIVGLFHPVTDEGRAAVLKLRTHPLTPLREPGLAYGLCRQHIVPTEQIEERIYAAARGVVIQ